LLQAGYTKDLLVISWVGFDDNSDLNLEGARSGLPIWAEFMNKAYQLYPVRNASGSSEPNCASRKAGAEHR
jgi:penicillin-binding protein 1B